MAMPQILQKRILRDSYSVSPVKGFLRTDMEVGLARQRRIASVMPTNLSFKMLLINRKELAVLETWYKLVLSNGTGWFKMFVDCGSGFVETDCRFTDAYSISVTALGVYEVSCQVECRELPVMSVEELEDDLV